MASAAMNPKRFLKNFTRGWLPKESHIAHAQDPLKPHRKLRWKAVTLSVVLAASLVVAGFVGVQTFWRYSNPAMDVTASYFEKTTNGTAVCVGDFVEVEATVYWHGYVFPLEFKRQMKIVDPVSEGYFFAVNGTNRYDSAGYGGAYILKYTLKVVAGEGRSVELPAPKLTLDNVEIPVAGTSPTITILAK